LQNGIEKEDSWYQRLARAIVETALPLLDIHIIEGGKEKVQRSLYNHNITQTHLLATWTQGGLDAPTINAPLKQSRRAPQHLSIPDLSLEDWKVRLLEDIGGHDVQDHNSQGGFESFRDVNSQFTQPKLFSPWPDSIPESIQQEARETEVSMHEQITLQIESGIPQVYMSQFTFSDSSIL